MIIFLQALLSTVIVGGLYITDHNVLAFAYGSLIAVGAMLEGLKND